MMGGNANAFKIQDPWTITVSPKRKTSDLQKRTQYGQQPADSDAEAVVQYLSKRLVKRRARAGTDGKDLFRPLLIIKKKTHSSVHRPILILIFSVCFTNGCEGGPGQNALSVIFLWSLFPSPILHGLLWLTCACGSRRNVLKLQFSRSALCSWISGQLYDTHGL